MADVNKTTKELDVSKPIKEIACGFNKWSIGIGEHDDVQIKYNYHPIYGEIHLYDISIIEIEALAKMFADWATLLKAQLELNKK